MVVVEDTRLDPRRLASLHLYLNPRTGKVVVVEHTDHNAKKALEDSGYEAIVVQPRSANFPSMGEIAHAAKNAWFAARKDLSKSLAGDSA